MNKLLLLYRVLRKCDAAQASDASAANEHSIPISMIVYPVLALCAMGGIGYVGYSFSWLFDALGGGAVALSVLSLVAGVILFLKSVVQLVNVLYMSTDTSLLLAMPVSPTALAAVRLVGPMVSSLALMAGVTLSFAVGYGLSASAGAAFFAGACLYTVFVPLFVTLLAAAAAMLLMSAFKVLRSRNAMRYVGVGIAVIGVLAYVGWDGISSMNIDAGKALGAVVGFSKDYTALIPVIPPVHAFVTTGNFLPVLGSVLLVAAAFCVWLLAAKRLYLKGAVGMQEAAASTKRLTDKALGRIYSAKTPRASYRQKELRQLLRNPAFLLKNFIIAFGWPVIIVPMFLLSMNNAIPSQDVPVEAEAWAPPLSGILMLTLGAVFAVVVFLNMFSELAYSSVTREGDTFEALKQLPLSFAEQIRAKRDVARTVVGITSVGYMAAAALVGVVMGKVPWYALVYGLLVGIPLLCVVVNVDMILGIRDANLHWDNEASAIKKKGKMILGSYLLAVLAIVGLALLYIFIDEHPFPIVPCLLAVPVLLIAAAVWTDRRMISLAETKLPTL